MTVCEEMVTVLESLRGVWDEDAVDDFDHACQSAALALADGADDELVLAAALHDIGHSPLLAGTSAAHDVIARDWLTPRFGTRVGWLAGAHVAAKRYLVATRPGYGQMLSAVSATSLAHQGGATADIAFTDHPWWPDALRLREYDDAAKVPGVQGISLEELVVIADRVARR
ncbi:HD phosphohydrolase-like protein [Mycolicibacterium phlei DSM 43072]|uniref:HD phosphohydrolase-like protein n=2 Tax=Mycolicibacterium phlei TaxID=1771 RepID=A0A5N5UYK5_MYCPH|nr:HD phosphohydrolase-like protein [Mycolicibacterium phlei DSM 43239 = CCUG 21000]KXW65366.1 HD phosphohydrolase-like protein [Mycolicibacterium phlei DSM 43239 = CCUG 21000]KXW70612.1 HD phosphohydrolase-like protein [Mycolicibacterium phlei DSM 43070]KXW72588.1 HD phosphohydrolase-like protein [Mycolicibacterium phlei DSM 43072]